MALVFAMAPVSAALKAIQHVEQVVGKQDGDKRRTVKGHTEGLSNIQITNIPMNNLKLISMIQERLALFDGL